MLLEKLLSVSAQKATKKATLAMLLSVLLCHVALCVALFVRPEGNKSLTGVLTYKNRLYKMHLSAPRKRGIKAAPPNRRRQLKSHIFIRSIPVLVSLDVDYFHDLRENHVDYHEYRKPEHVAYGHCRKIEKRRQ